MPSEHKDKVLNEMESALARLQERSQLRDFAQIEGVNFCSNDYLGLAQDHRLKEAVMEAVKAAPLTGGTGSRLLSGHDVIWNGLEEEFAEFAGMESALYFSSGYGANVGLLTAILGKHDVVFSDALNHASLIDGIRLSGARREIYPHLDLNALEALLRVHKTERCRKIIVTESVFSMDGDLAPLPQLARCVRRRDLWLIVDDAHGLGVVGADGGGVLEHFGLGSDAVPVLVGTLGKAFGSFGAFVAGSAELIEFLIQKARTYVYTTALPQPVAAATRAALALVRTESWRRERLRTLVGRFRMAAHALGVPLANSTTPIQPVLLGSAAAALAAQRELACAGYWVVAIRPPSVPAGSARLRVTLSAAHTEAEIDGLAEQLGRACGGARSA